MATVGGWLTSLIAKVAFLAKSVVVALHAKFAFLYATLKKTFQISRMILMFFPHPYII